jgi:hypothetical protein
MELGEALAAFAVVVILGAMLTGAVLVVRVVLTTLNAPRSPGGRPSPPDDWDDEEYISRHHH